MIYIYGDSHGLYNFRGLTTEHCNLSYPAITMFRIGRDKNIIGFQPEHLSESNTFILNYGEIDCRCHIGRQTEDFNIVCHQLIDAFFTTISETITKYKQIIICGIVPSIRRHEYEDIHGPVTHAFPYVGSDDERSRNSLKMNELIVASCVKYGYIYIDLFEDYARSDNTLKFELSDQICHIKENKKILDKLSKIITTEI